MNKQYRHEKLLNILNEREILSTEEIIHLLDVSPATARRDITMLDKLGLLQKVRNGAQSVAKESISNHRNYLSNNVNQINNFSEKERIARVAANLCQRGESVFLTCGSTMMMLGQSLCGSPVQIITNYLPLANLLIEHDHNDVVIMGGQYNKNQAITLSLGVGVDCGYSANIMFTSGRGISAKGLYKTDMLIANSEQKMLDKVGRLIVLLDSQKLGKEVGMIFTELNRIDTLVTGKEADPDIISTLKARGLNIILA
ncbi:HTH-type transcriptional regulator UlaR [Pasteurellaceae bacterium TAE3-ERU1]|nr:HTH-type transcriptional regulator UlaR [Pasteurellaceae bacterium TAE3-ERU1]